MKNFRNFIKKTTLFTTLDLSAPTRYNESVVSELQEQSEKLDVDYCIFTPINPHIIFENYNFEVSNLSAQEIQESRNRFEKLITEDSAPILDKLVEENDLEKFKESLAENIRDIDSIAYFNSLREELGYDKIKLDLNIKTSNIRERFFKGEVFNEGSFVSFDEEKGVVLSKSTNHVSVMSEDGIISNKFITDLSELNETLTYGEDPDSLLNFHFYNSSDNISTEIFNEFSDDQISLIPKMDYLLDRLDIFESLNELHDLIEKNNLQNLYPIIENLIEGSTKGDHVIYNNKTDVTKKVGFKNRDDAYDHLKTNLNYDQDYSVVNKANLGKHKTHNDKYKRTTPNHKYKNEVKDYNVANDIVDKEEYVKMKKGTLRNGMTRKKSTVIKMPKVREQYSFTDTEIDKIVENIDDKALLEAYETDEFVNVVEGISISEQSSFNKDMMLKERTTQGELNNKALRLAKTKLRKILSVVALKDLSAGDRIKLERIVANNTAAINTIAMKLSPELKKMELKRLIKKEEK